MQNLSKSGAITILTKLYLISCMKKDGYSETEIADTLKGVEA